MSSGYRSDIPGRVLGTLVFLAGVGLLGLVFYMAYTMFNLSPERALGLTFTGNPKLDPPAMKIGIQFGWLFGRIALLFVMAAASSWISQKGINLYFSCAKGVPVNVTPKPNQAAVPPATSTAESNP